MTSKLLGYTVQEIKEILFQEHESFLSGLKPIDRLNPYYACAMRRLKNDIEKCETIEDLHFFIHDSRQMSINDWIETL